MKKLIIAAVIVCAAVMGQAASVSWDVDWVYSNDGEAINTYDDGSVVNFWIVNLGSAADTSGLGVDADGNLIDAGNTVVGSGTLPTFGSGTANGEIANGNYLAMVIYDSDNKLYGVSAAEQVSGIVEAPPTAGALENRVFQNDPEGYMVANTALPVPEPTSGLLLLLGVAGMALKRKRA